MNGIIVIDKEPGFTSHDVVAKLRGICRQKKIGHTGTLDPQATGVLPVCLGNATKVCGLLTDQDKEYEAELLLGLETDTQDTTGTVLRRADVTVSEQEACRILMSFQGTYDQLPPMYSALKVDGKKLYELARAGREVERRPRAVTIRRIEILECALPVIRFRVRVSKGTYIRTLCADAGARLGCGGAMRSLRRTRVGDFDLSRAYTLSQVEALRDEGRLEEALLPVDRLFEDCPAMRVLEEFARLLENGNPLLPEHLCPLPEDAAEIPAPVDGQRVRLYGEGGRFLGIYAYEEEQGRYRPVRMFL